MKRFNIKVCISLFFFVFLFCTKVKAQVNGLDCLGTHCYISVYLNSDPVTSDGYLKYTICIPNENIYAIQGPASAYLSNHLGNSVDIYIKKAQLEMAVDGYANCEVPYELLVDKWVDYWGNYTTDILTVNSNGGYSRCYYFIKLLVQQ